jgi:hypothetical protein
MCRSGLSAQIKEERLMLVPVTADGFRDTVVALRSLDGSKVVNFHTFSLTEDHCVLLLLSKIGRNMLEDAVREQLQSLGIRDQGVLQLRSCRRDQSGESSPLNPHFIV